MTRESCAVGTRNAILKVRIRGAILRAILRAMAELHCVSTLKFVARNIAAVESRPTSPTLHATNFFGIQTFCSGYFHSLLLSCLLAIQPLTQTRRFLLLMRAFSSPSKRFFFFAKRRHFGLRDVNIIA